MNTALAAVGRGLSQPVHDAQRVFRQLLEAMARPGRVQVLPPDALDGIDGAGLGRATTALLLSLLDAETSVWMHPALCDAATLEHVRFHTGVRIAGGPARAAFAVTDAAHAEAALWSALSRGSDEVPQDGATLIVDVPSLDAGLPLLLRGPGIASTQTLHVGGLDPVFWQARAELEAAFPRGIDLILSCGDRIAALPRSTHLLLEG